MPMKTIGNSSSKIGIARTILTVSAVTAIIMSFALNWNLPGIQIPLSILLIVSGFTYISHISRKELTQFQASLLILSVVIAAFVAVRAAPLLIFVNTVASLFLLSVAALDFSWQRPLKLSEYILLTWVLPLFAFSSIETLVRKLDIRVVRQLNSHQKSILRGVLLAVPLLVVFGLLFSAADAVFANIFKNLFSFDLSISAEFLGRAVFCLILLGILAPVFTYMFLSSHAKQSDEIDFLPVRTYEVELAIVLGSLNLLFFLFIVVQAVYLFGSQDFVLNGSMTYAEYGRRGFFELLVVSMLVFSISYGIQRLIGLSKKPTQKYLLFALILQVGIIMLSALRRLGLYEGAYGFTELRFYSHSFIFFLAAAFFILVYSIVSAQNEGRLLKMLVVLSAIYIVALNAVNPDAKIANSNLQRFQTLGKVDASYVRTLSHDAIDQKISIYTDLKDENSQEEFRVRLCRDAEMIRNNSPSWSTWNASYDHAKNRLREIRCDIVGD